MKWMLQTFSDIFPGCTPNDKFLWEFERLHLQKTCKEYHLWGHLHLMHNDKSELYFIQTLVTIRFKKTDWSSDTRKTKRKLSLCIRTDITHISNRISAILQTHKRPKFVKYLQTKLIENSDLVFFYLSLVWPKVKNLTLIIYLIYLN
jgi:hypothetical protein